MTRSRRARLFDRRARGSERWRRPDRLPDPSARARLVRDRAPAVRRRYRRGRRDAAPRSPRRSWPVTTGWRGAARAAGEHERDHRDHATMLRRSGTPAPRGPPRASRSAQAGQQPECGANLLDAWARPRSHAPRRSRGRRVAVGRRDRLGAAERSRRRHGRRHALEPAGRPTARVRMSVTFGLRRASQNGPAGNRTRAGSTPKTPLMCAASSVSAGGPSATIRPALISAIRGKKFAASARS